MGRYKETEEKEILENGYTCFMACCDCGLVHEEWYEIKGDKIVFRSRRNNRRTGQIRRFMKQRKEGIFEER